MKHILSVNPIAFINEDLKQGDHFMHSIFEKVCEVGAKSIVLMEEFYDVQPHLNLYKANELKKQISQYGLRADACWYYTDPLRAAYVSSRKEVIDQMREYVCNTAYMGAKYLLLPPGEPSPDRFRTWREAQDDLQDLYEHVIPICEENNVVLCMEAGRNLSPLSSPRGSLDIVKRVGSPYLQVAPNGESWRIPTPDRPNGHCEAPDSGPQEPESIEFFKELLPYSPFICGKFFDYNPETDTDPTQPVEGLCEALRNSDRQHIITVIYEGFIPEAYPERDPVEKVHQLYGMLKRRLDTVDS